MNEQVDSDARRHLGLLARRFAIGAITNQQFEEDVPSSKQETALYDIFFYGLWPLYSDFSEYKLTGRQALTRKGRRWVARIVLFLQLGLPYRYPRITGLAQLPVFLLSLMTLGLFGRYWRKRQWQGGDESVWPFFSQSEYNEALKRPVLLGGDVRQGAQVNESLDNKE